MPCETAKLSLSEGIATNLLASGASGLSQRLGVGNTGVEERKGLTYHFEGLCVSQFGNHWCNGYDSVFQTGFREWLPRVPSKDRNETLMRHFYPSVFLQEVEQTLGSLHRVPWTTQIFTESSVAATGLKNTGYDMCFQLQPTCFFKSTNLSVCITLQLAWLVKSCLVFHHFTR